MSKPEKCDIIHACWHVWYLFWRSSDVEGLSFFVESWFKLQDNYSKLPFQKWPKDLKQNHPLLILKVFKIEKTSKIFTATSLDSLTLQPQKRKKHSPPCQPTPTPLLRCPQWSADRSGRRPRGSPPPTPTCGDRGPRRARSPRSQAAAVGSCSVAGLEGGWK